MAGRTTGLGPTSSPQNGTIGASVRLGKIASVTGSGTALLVLVLIEIAFQMLLRRSFKRAHGG